MTQGRLKRGLILLAGILLLVAALIHSILTNPEWRNFDFQLFLRSFRDVAWSWMLASFALIYATYVTRAIRWRILIRPIKPEARLWSLLSATVIGFGAIAVMGRPGEFVRPYLIARKEDVPLSGQLAIWVLERSFDTLIVLAAVAFAVARFQPQSVAGPLPPQWWNSMGEAVGLGTAIVLSLLILLRGYYQTFTRLFLRLLGRIQIRSLQARLGSIENGLEVFGSGLQSLRDWRSMLGCLAWSFLQWLLIALAYYAVLTACAKDLDFQLTQAVIFMGVAMAGSAFQIPGVGGGVQIASVLALTEVFGMQVELASSTAILIWVMTFLAVLPPALILLVHEGLSWAKLRQLGSEV
jgi:uncharacterized protein (TIRG00374 family)